MQWAKRLVLGVIGFMSGIAILACGNDPVVIQGILAEGPAGPANPPAGQGILAIGNLSEQLSVTCVRIRRTSADPTSVNPWGSNRLARVIGPGRQEQFTLDEGLYDIAIIRPSLTALDLEETDLNFAFLISELQVHVITVNDFSFEDVEPNCVTATGGGGGGGGMGT